MIILLQKKSDQKKKNQKQLPKMAFHIREMFSSVHQKYCRRKMWLIYEEFSKATHGQQQIVHDFP